MNEIKSSKQAAWKARKSGLTSSWWGHAMLAIIAASFVYHSIHAF